MAFGFYFFPDFFDFAIEADQEGTADYAHVSAAHEFFELPDAEGLDGFVIWIAKEWEV